MPARDVPIAPPSGAPSAAPPRWTVRVLGGLDLDDGQQTLTRLPSRAITLLLARLALQPARAHAREELIDLMWPDADLEVGRRRLRHALSILKGILEPAGRSGGRPVLDADRIGVRVVAGGLVSDATRFEQAVRAGDAEQALALYRGELLPGFYDEWIVDERERLAALHERIAGLPRTSVPAPPGPRRAAVARGARRDAHAGRLPLPVYLTRIFGAAGDMARLREQVLAHRLVTVLGPGGSGKTRIAVEIAHALQPQDDPPAGLGTARFDVVAFVPLVGSTTRAQACDALTGALQIAATGDDVVGAVVAALNGRRALLVLDNFEQLQGVADDVVARLAGTLPMLHMLVTSRRALGLDGEREFLLSPLELPPPGADRVAAADNPAVALFVDRARAVRSDFHLGAGNGATLVELVRALEGMPLAIELAASRVRAIAPVDMLARLRGSGTPRLDLLERPGRRAAFDPRHASMQRVIAWSWEMLEAAPARLLGALAVFPGSFTAAAAEVLAGDEGFDVGLVLGDLIAGSLVHMHAGEGERWRFAIYQPIREFAAARLDAATASHWRAGQRASVVAWATALPMSAPLDEIRVEMPNVLAALASAVDDDAPDDAIRLLVPLHRYLEDVELPAEGLVHVRASVERCADPVLQALGHTLLAPLLFAAGQAETALGHAEAGVAAANASAAQRVRALYVLARVRWRSRLGIEQVESLVGQAEAIAGGVGDAGMRANLLAQRAYLANVLHRDHARSEKLHAEALALWQAQGDPHAVNRGRYHLAVAAQNAGRHRLALERLAPVVDDARELHHWHNLSQALNVRGNAHSELREWVLAVADYQEAIRIAWEAIASYDLAFALWNLPRALAHRRQPLAALRIAAHASAFWRQRFGELSASDLRDLRRLKRLAARQVDAAVLDAEWRAGEGLELAQVVALALQPVAAD